MVTERRVVSNSGSKFYVALSAVVFLWAIFSSPLVGVQWLIFGEVFIGTGHAKVLLFFVATVFFLCSLSRRFDANIFSALLALVGIVTLSFLSILFNNDSGYFSIEIVSYYYLTFFGSFLLYCSFSRVRYFDFSRVFLVSLYWVLVFFVLFSFFISIHRFYSSGCFFGFVDCNALEVLGFRISSISGYERAFALQQRPVDLGLVCVFISALFFLFFLERRKRLDILIAFTCCLIVILTFSRTAYLMLASVFFVFVALYPAIRIKNKVLMAILFFQIGVFSSLYLFFSEGGGVLDPHNLILRFGHWSDALELLFADFNTFLFGLGRVQNGNFGAIHSMVIDNTYIAVMMAGGFLSLTLYVMFWALVIRFIVIHRCSKVTKLSNERLIELSFMIAFLVAGLTENLLNRAYFVFVFCVFIRTLGFCIRNYSVKSRDMNYSVAGYS